MSSSRPISARTWQVMPEARGEDYNRNNFEGVHSMVICNPWYANQVLNLDPVMMTLPR